VALAHPLLGPRVWDAMRAIYHAAHGRGGERRECFGCTRPWRPKRSPALVAVLGFSDPPEQALAFLCAACGGDEATATAALCEGLRRDLMDNVELVPASALAPEGGSA
jgi:hypothetical protein